MPSKGLAGGARSCLHQLAERPSIHPVQVRISGPDRRRGRRWQINQGVDAYRRTIEPELQLAVLIHHTECRIRQADHTRFSEAFRPELAIPTREILQVVRVGHHDAGCRAALAHQVAGVAQPGRFVVERGAADSRTVAWLEETVEETANPEAMLMLGNLHARGVATERNLRVAQRWYRDAVKAGTDNAQIVNEVAWTLAVSDLKRLRRGRFANRIMTRMMESNEQARAQPEYLDTWAATYAATGNFREAVRLQEMAVQAAIQADRDDVLDILRRHLDLFLNGKPVMEMVP